MKALLSALLLSATMAFVLGGASAAVKLYGGDQSQTPVYNTVRVKRLVLVDENNRMRGYLGMNKGQVQLIFFENSGPVVVSADTMSASVSSQKTETGGP